MLFGLAPRDLLEILLMPIALALLAPWITRRWQERQRDSKTKVGLVTEISRLVMTTVMTFHLSRTHQTGHGTDVQKLSADLDVAYKKWVIGSCVIGSKLHAYFPDP